MQEAITKCCIENSLKPVRGGETEQEDHNDSCMSSIQNKRVGQFPHSSCNRPQPYTVSHLEASCWPLLQPDRGTSPSNATGVPRAPWCREEHLGRGAGPGAQPSVGVGGRGGVEVQLPCVPPGPPRLEQPTEAHAHPHAGHRPEGFVHRARVEAQAQVRGLFSCSRSG